MGCYELRTGEFHWVTEEEADYGGLARDGVYDKKELYDVFEEEKDNYHVGFWIEPSDEEIEGDFYETK